MKRAYLASISFIVLFFALFSSSLYETEGKMRLGRFILWSLGLLFFFVSYTSKKDTESKFKDELRTILGVSFTIQLLLLPSCITLIKDHAIFALFIYIGTFILSVLLFYIDLPHWKSLVSTKKVAYFIAVSLIAMTACTLYLRHNTIYFLWDSHSMYELISANDVYALLNFSKLSLSHHISYSYVALCTIFKLLVDNAMIGQALFGFALYALGVYGFYKCIMLFNNNADRSITLILTALFALSPYMLGMITYSYPDYAMWCVFPILAYFLYTKKYLLVAYTGFFFIFLKETALITYVFLVIGCYLIGIYKTKNIFYDIKNYLLTTVPCFMWIISYLFIGHWDGSGAFEINSSYIRYKLMSLFFINFNWLLMIILLVAVFTFTALKKKRNNHEISMFPMILSMIAYIIFSVLFKTVNHARYTDALIAQIYLLTAFVLMNYIEKKSIQTTLSITLTVLLFSQSFITIDPVMLKAFPNLNIGNATMITTNEILSDGMSYNRQYQGWGKVVDAALEDIVTDKSSMIFLPSICNVTWHFDAMAYMITLDENGEATYTAYWDTYRKTRMADCHTGIEYNVHVINNNYSFSLNPAQKGYYLYSPICGKEIADKIKTEYNCIEDVFSYKGWIVNRVTFWE